MINLDSVVHAVQELSEEHGITYLEALEQIKKELSVDSIAIKKTTLNNILPRDCDIDNGEVYSTKTGQTISNPYEEYGLC